MLRTRAGGRAIPLVAQADFGAEVDACVPAPRVPAAADSLVSRNFFYERTVN